MHERLEKHKGKLNFSNLTDILSQLNEISTAMQSFNDVKSNSEVITTIRKSVTLVGELVIKFKDQLSPNETAYGMVLSTICLVTENAGQFKINIGDFLHNVDIEIEDVPEEDLFWCAGTKLLRNVFNGRDLFYSL